MEFRFKTEAEFVATLGKDWRDTVNMGWNSKMDVFFGIPLEELDFVYDSDITTVVGELEESWTISREMVTVIKHDIDLKQPKKNR